jgi:hypothetical protein
MNERKNSNENAANEAILKDIRTAVIDLEFGTVTIKVHNAKITQIEVTHKRRYDDGSFYEKGGGI